MLLVRISNHGLSPDDLSARFNGGRLTRLALIVQDLCEKAFRAAAGPDAMAAAARERDPDRHVMVEIPFDATLGGGGDRPLVVTAEFVGWPKDLAPDPDVNEIYAELRREARAKLRRTIADDLGTRLSEYFTEGRPLRIIVRENDTATTATWSR